MTEGPRDRPVRGPSSHLVSSQQGQLQRGGKWAGAIPGGPHRKNGAVGVAWPRKGQVSDSAPHVTFPSTLCPILGTWPEQTRQDIGQSLHSAHVEVKGAYVHLTWHDRDLNTHAPVLLRQRELLKLTEAEAEGKGHCKLGRPSGMGLMGWVFLGRPWDLSCLGKGTWSVSAVAEFFPYSHPRVGYATRSSS